MSKFLRILGLKVCGLKVCWNGLCFCLLTGFLLAPNPSHAQNRTPARQLQGEEARMQEDAETAGDNVYRHTKTVIWIANLFHKPATQADIEATARGLEFINFAIIALAIGIPLFRMLPKALHKRSETLTADIAQARKATGDAQTRLGSVEAKLAALDSEIAVIRKQVEEDGRHDEARIKAAIEEDSKRIVADAEQEIAFASAQAQRALKQFAAELAIDRAVSGLRISPEADRAVLAEFGSSSNGHQPSTRQGGDN